jgi:hypothetical protein
MMEKDMSDHEPAKGPLTFSTHSNHLRKPAAVGKHSSSARKVQH